jgi:uncharacterized membrane protein SpoIIM required for sporulation
MQHDQFVTSRQERWSELESLLGRAGRGRVTRLGGDDFLRLGSLYRVAASDLALARKYFPTDRATLYLNGLVRRAHPIVYQPSASRAEIGDFVRYGFPAAFRKVGPYTAFAFGIFLLSAALAAAAVVYHSANAGLLIGQAEVQSLQGVMSQHHLWMGANTSNHSVAANFIMLNNIKVAFIAFAGGILLGLGTIYIMAQNGIMIGAIGAMVAQYGLSRQFWSFVVPHGVLELSVIFMAGGAGLMMGDAILRPGQRPRSKALAGAARVSAQIILGCVPLLVIAGTIEGFFSASNAPAWLKVGIGVVSGALLYAYVLGARGRKAM